MIVTGAAGFLGRHACRAAVAEGHQVVATFHGEPADLPGVRAERLDVTDTAGMEDLIKRVRPEAVIHTAASLGRSLVPSDGAREWDVNAVAPVRLAQILARHGGRYLFLSTDALFTGRPTPFREDDRPRPLSPYGAAKAAAELGIGAVLPAALLVRTSMICAEPGGELSQRERMILDLVAGPSGGGALFTDDIRCPIAVTDLAAALVELAATDVAGVLNVAGPEAVSWYEYGTLVAARAGADPARVPAGSIRDSPVRRPGDVRLDSSRAAGLLRTRLRGMRELYAVSR